MVLYIYIYTHKCERTPFQVFKLKNILILISRYLNKKINKLFKFIHLNLSRFAIQNKKIYPNSDQLIIQKKTNATVRKLWKKKLQYGNNSSMDEDHVGYSPDMDPSRG